MIMAFSGMDKDERWPSLRNRFLHSGRGVDWEKVYFGHPLSDHSVRKRVTVDVVDSAIVKGVCWGYPSVPGGAEGVKT